MNKLMNNWLVAMIFGVLVTLVVFVGTLGEPNGVWFSGIFGLVFVMAKELVNNQLLSNPWNQKIFNFGFLGVVITVAALLFV